MRISDGSSDVCSSDLFTHGTITRRLGFASARPGSPPCGPIGAFSLPGSHEFQTPKTSDGSQSVGRVVNRSFHFAGLIRTEERRVGKEGVSTCRSRGSPSQSKKETQPTNRHTQRA